MKKHLFTSAIVCLGLLAAACHTQPWDRYHLGKEWDNKALYINEHRDARLYPTPANAERMAKGMAKRFAEDYDCPELLPEQTPWQATTYCVVYRLKDYDLVLMPRINRDALPYLLHSFDDTTDPKRTLLFVAYVFPKNALPTTPDGQFINVSFFANAYHSPLTLPNLAGNVRADIASRNLDIYPKPIAKALCVMQNPMWRHSSMVLLPSGLARHVAINLSPTGVHEIRIEVKQMQGLWDAEDEKKWSKNEQEKNAWKVSHPSMVNNSFRDQGVAREIRMSDIMLGSSGNGMSIVASGTLGKLPNEVPCAFEFLDTQNEPILMHKPSDPPLRFPELAEPYFERVRRGELKDADKTVFVPK